MLTSPRFQSKKARTMTARLDNVEQVADLFKGFVFCEN